MTLLFFTTFRMAHGITNLGLGIYVLLTGNWIFW